MGIFVVKHCITILCTKTAAGILEEEGMSWGSAADQTVIYPETFRGQPITGQVHVKVGRFIKRQNSVDLHIYIFQIKNLKLKFPVQERNLK